MPKDKVTIERIKLLHPAIQRLTTLAIDRVEAKLVKNMAIRVVQGIRTFSEQDGLYALGRTVINPDGKSAKKPKGNIVTNAKGGQSIHNYGLAIDFALLVDRDNNGTYEELSWSMILDLDKDGKKDWDEVVEAFEFYGFSWGGKWRTFKDYPHCDMAYGQNYKYFLEKHTKKDFIPGTKFVKV